MADIDPKRPYQHSRSASFLLGGDQHEPIMNSILVRIFGLYEN